MRRTCQCRTLWRPLGSFASFAVALMIAGASPAAAADDYMLIDAERLASLPASGAQFEYMKRVADDAIATTRLSSPGSTSPWLPNYGGKGAETLAAALVYARTGNTRYRDFVIAVNRFVIGSEDSPSTNGTAEEDKLLATMRQIGAYVLAADLVSMDPDTTGSRSGYGSKMWRTWLAALRNKPIGDGNCDSIVLCNLRATNWGAWASAARTVIDVYIGDSVDREIAVDRLKLYLGETMSGTPWIRSTSFDSSWACLPSGLPVSFVPVNGSSCGLGKDGIIVEDASRSSYYYPSFDDKGIDYTFHAYGAQLIAALVLDRQGYDVWGWGDNALKRIMDRLDRLGVATGNDRSGASHVSWIPRHFYGESYPTVPAQAGNTLGFTDWLFGRAAAPVPPPPPPPPPPAAPTAPDAPSSGTSAIVMGATEPGTIWTRMSVDAKRSSRYAFSGSASTITGMLAQLDGEGETTGSQPVRGVIYSDYAGAPHRPLATTYETTVYAGQSLRFVTLRLPAPLRIVGGVYWLGLHSGGTSAVARYAATSSSGAMHYGSDDYTDGPSSPFGNADGADKAISLALLGVEE